MEFLEYTGELMGFEMRITPFIY